MEKLKEKGNKLSHSKWPPRECHVDLPKMAAAVTFFPYTVSASFALKNGDCPFLADPLAKDGCRGFNYPPHKCRALENHSKTTAI